MAMFDWPEQTQTSPTSTSRTVMVFSPATVISSGPPADSGSSDTRQRPLASAVVEALRPPISTLTCSPGAAVPQTGTEASR
jgi:hypothetical protein